MEESKSIKNTIKRIILKYMGLMIASFIILYLVSIIVLFISSTFIPHNDYTESIKNEIIHELDKLERHTDMLTEEAIIIEKISEDSFNRDAIQLLYDVKNNTKLDLDFLLVNRDKEIVSSSYHENSYSYVINSLLFRNIETELSANNVVHNTHNRLFPSSTSSIFYIGKPVSNDGETIGYLVFIVNDFIYETVQNRVVFVIDDFKNILSQTHFIWTTPLGKIDFGFQGNISEINNDYYYSNSIQLNKYNLSIITFTNINMYKNMLLYGLGFIIVSTFVIIISTLIVTPKILKKTLQPLESLIIFMKNEKEKQIQDNELLNYEYDEISVIYKEYNSKVNEIKSLIKTNNEIVNKKNSLEIKNLESKYNPHFLYNVLEMIKYEIYIDPENAANIIVIISKLLRYNINDSTTTVPMKTDLAYLEDYIRLQKMRFGKRLTVEISNTIKQPKILVPKGVIQPLIENAIKHNINYVSNLIIEIDMLVSNSKLKIVVKDNGRGMTDAKLKKVKDIINGNGIFKKNNGLKNTNNIISLLYGKDYGLQIDSYEDVGTTITVTLPLMEGIDHD